MTKRTEGLNVTVSGPNQLLVRTGAAVISEALVNSGLKNVTAVDLGGAPVGGAENIAPTYLESAETLLKQVRQQQPQLLDEPALVQYFDTEEQPERDEITPRDLRPDISQDPILSDGPSEDDLSPAQDEAVERDLEAE